MSGALQKQSFDTWLYFAVKKLACTAAALLLLSLAVADILEAAAVVATMLVQPPRTRSEPRGRRAARCLPAGDGATLELVNNSFALLAAAIVAKPAAASLQTQ